MSEMDRTKLEELLSAYLDGEVNSREAKLVEDALREDEDARRLLDDLRQTAALISSLPRHDAPRSIADDLWSRVERDELLGDVEAAPAVPRGRRSRLPGLLAIAATLAMVVGGGLWIIRGGLDRARQVDRVALGTSKQEIPAQPRRATEKRAVTPKRSGERSSGDVASPDMAKGRQGTTGRMMKRSSARKPRTLSPSRKSVVSESSELVSRSPGPIPTEPEPTNLLALADVEQKLAAGVDARALQGHRFTNETVRLQLTLRDEAKREEITTRIADYLKNRRVVDLSGSKARGSRRRDQTGRFFHRGKPGLNFDDINQRQILVRIRRYELDGLFAEMAEQAGATEDVALVSGPIAVRGFDEARDLLRYHGGDSRHAALKGRAWTVHEPMPPAPEENTAAPKGAYADASDEPSTAVDDFLDDMMKFVDVDTDRERSVDDSHAQAGATAKVPPIPADASRDEQFSLFVSRPRPMVLEAEGQGDVSGKPDDKRIASAMPRSAFTAGERPLLKTRQSLVESRWQASQASSRLRAGEKKTSPAADFAGGLPDGDRRGIHALARPLKRPSSTGKERVTKTHAARDRGGRVRPGAWGSEVGFVTLVVELTVAKPDSPSSGTGPAEVTRPPSGPAPSHTSRPGSSGTGKARKNGTKSKRRRVPQ